MPREEAESCFISNSHGAGFAYIKDGEVKVEKGYFSFEKFWEDFEPIQEENDDPKLVHFRIATSGHKDKTNCHPWQIDKDHALIHNGIISHYSLAESRYSDTGLFTHYIMKKIVRYGLDEHDKPHMRWLIEGTIGGFNKVAVLTSNGNFTLYNKDKWHVHNGIWYSNHDYDNSFFLERRNGVHRTHMHTDYDEDFSSSVPKKPRLKIKDLRRNKFIKASEVAQMKDEYQASITELVGLGLIEKIYESAKEEGPNPMSPDYKDFWLGYFAGQQLNRFGSEDEFETEHYSG